MSEFIEQLKSGNKQQVLRSFHHWMLCSETSAIAKLATDENFDGLFDFMLELSGPDEIVLASEIVRKFINVIPVSYRIPRLAKHFVRCLEHESTKIRDVILKELKICADDNSSLEHFAEKLDLIVRAASLVGDDNLAIAMSSCNFLTSLGRDHELTILILSPPTGNVLKNIMVKNDILKMRVYEVIMKIASYSIDNLLAVAENSYFENLHAQVKRGDDLLLLNYLEVVKELVVTDYGLKYLHDINFIQAASILASESLEPPHSYIVLPGILKFFFSIGELHPEYVFHRHNSIVQCVFNLLEGLDPLLLCIATDGIGLLGNSMEGKKLLQNEGKMLCALHSFRANLQQSSSTELKFHVIQALSRLLSVNKEERIDNLDFESVLEGWFKQISEDPGNLLFTLCRQPFLEVRHSALYLLHVVVMREWGQKIMVSVPGFAEFLLDYSSERTVTGKELKFKVLTTLISSSCFERIFDTGTVNKVIELHSKGPFYMKVESAVAVDEPL